MSSLYHVRVRGAAGVEAVAAAGRVRYAIVVAPVLIVKTGTTVPDVARRRRDFESWISASMGLQDAQVQTSRVYEGDALPDRRAVSAVVVTGSSAMVTDRDAWSERTAEWLADAVGAGVAVLGICYGHQLLAHALGGRVENNPHGRHIGTVDVRLTDAAHADPLFMGFDPVLHVPVSHRQSVTELPAGARLLATAERDPLHAFAVGERAWGVQFHPEFDADIVRGYIDARREQLVVEGLDADALWQCARDTRHGRELLERFARLVRAEE
jgi:GMP synthase (glutamine-hydrolysing)